jgi:hypothetical protein
MTKPLLLAAAALTLVACSDDPVSYSEPVGINLRARPLDSAEVGDEKAISTEQRNPYGAFVANARAALDGSDPGRIEVDRVEVALGAGSTGVTRLDEVFAGNVDVLFQMNDTATSYPVATHDMTGVLGPAISLGISFDPDAMSADDFPTLLAGGFKVVVRGDATPGFQDSGADAELQVTLTFSALR